MSEPFALLLGRKIRDFAWEEVTPKALAVARTAIIDTIGVTLAGAAEPCTQILLATPGVGDAPGECTVLGTDRRTSALDAAFVNGTASHALDYDDFSFPMGGHQSVPVVSPLLALAEERSLSGQALVTAYAIGIETEIRIARAVNFYHYDKGWHPTTTLGVFGAAAAVGHAIGLGAEKIATALAIAASLAAGLKANFGTMTKPLHVGHCCRSGLLAALLAERGFDANPSALEHRQGFLMAFNGPGNYDTDRMFEGWAAPLELESELMGLKQFPCCGSTHSAILMALSLGREGSFAADDITGIRILVHPRRLPHTNNPDPRTPLGAKFSLQYVVARALVDQAVRLAHFEGEAHSDPRIQRLLAVTQAGPHPEMTNELAKQFGAEVIVTLKDGRTLSRRIEDQVGRGGDNPMSSDELWEKFYDCAKRALPRQDIMPIFERLELLERIGDMAQIVRRLGKSAPPSSLPAARATRPAAAVSGNTLAETSWVP